MRDKRAQSALEFLTTYGWAFLVILIMISALAYFGVLNPPVTDRCQFDAGFDCPEMVITAEAAGVDAQIIVTNGLGTGISISAATITGANTGCTPITGVAQAGTIASGSDFGVNITCGGATEFAVDEQPQLTIILDYTEVGGTLTQKAKGTLVGTAK